MRASRGVSSLRQVSAWLIVAGGLALYGALALTLGIAPQMPSVPLPWWAVQAVPPILYAIAVRLFIRRVSIVRWGLATLCLWALHLALGALTVAVVSYIEPLPASFAAVDGFPPPALLGTLWVALFLIPFRDVIRGHSPKPSGRGPAGRRASGVDHDGLPKPLPAGQVTPTKARAGAPSQARTPGLAPSADRRSTEKQPRQTGGTPRPASGQRGPADKDVVRNKAADTDAVAAGAAAPAIPDPSPETAFDASPVLMRVSFGRVAGQLPAGAFRMPLERIGPSLQEPDHLLIPQRLVLGQLAEGIVRAGWDVVARQFPHDALAMTDEDITARLADGQLVLPLDELVPQLPGDLFSLNAQVADIESIANVPPPFEPVAADKDGERRAAERVPEDEPRAAGASSDVTVLEDVELDPLLTEAVDGQPGTLPDIETPCPPSHRRSAADAGGWPRPRWEGGGPLETLPPPGVSPDRDAGATIDRVAARLAQLGPLGVAVESVEGDAAIVTLSGPESSRIPGAAGVLLPLLAEGRAPWPVSQLTMWGTDTVLILTPLEPMSTGGPILVSTLPPGGPVASVEKLSLRAVCAGASDSRQLPLPDPDQGQDRGLVDVEPASRVRQIGASLTALGAVSPSVFRDADSERNFYLFLPEETDVRMTCRFAGEVDQAARRLAVAGHTFHTAVLRCGGRRLIIRLERAASGRAAIVVAGGHTERAGLASRQVEAAARLLRAS